MVGDGNQSLANFVRVLNEHWGRNRRVQSFKNRLRAQAPSLFIRLKAGFGALEDEATWVNLLSAQERDDLYLVREHDPTPDEIARNRELNARFLASDAPVKKINWFIPALGHALYGGVNTILRFAARLQNAHGIECKIILYNYAPEDIPDIERQMASAFPTLAPHVLFHAGKSPDDVPASDISVATYWTSAYRVSKVSNTRAKFYMIQDYEPLFYEGGTRYGLVDTTYRLGFLRLVNTPGLLDWIKTLHGDDGTAFVPSVDRTVYFPEDATAATTTTTAAASGSGSDAVRIFFYARPMNARNGFILGLEALKRVKARYGERVEIVCAGEEWSPLTYGAGGVLENLGRLATAPEVAALYRSCDIGLVFMFSKHPSYQPFEFMASGCCVVTNENNATKWMLKHGENAMIAESTVAAVAAALGALVEDGALRERLRASGLASVAQRDWNETIDDACRRARIIPAAATTTTTEPGEPD